MSNFIKPQQIEQKIFIIRGQKVMLDSDLAELYDVETKKLIQAMKRNIERFPSDFMFQLSPQENKRLRSQIVTLEKGRGLHRKYLPYVFTEHGILMLSSVLNSERAIQSNIAIMRTFIKLRETLSLQKKWIGKLAELENKIKGHDQDLHALFDAIRQLMAPPTEAQRKIGFAKRVS